MPLLYFQRAKRDHYFVNRVNSREDRCPENHELNLYPKGKALEHLFFFFLTFFFFWKHYVAQAVLALTL